MRRHRILFLNHVGRISGAERSLLDLARHLNRDRFDPQVALPADGELAARMVDNGIACHPLPFRRIRKTVNPLQWAITLAHVVRRAHAVAEIIRRNRVDLVHANSNTAQLYGGLAARWTGVPSIWHTRDLVNLGLIGTWCGSTASRTIAISESVRQHAARYVRSPDRLRLIYNGVALDEFTPRHGRTEMRATLGIPETAPLVGMVAQLSPWKRHELFLEAASRLASAVPACHFLLVTEDVFQDQPGRLAALKARALVLNLSGRVLFIPFGQDVVSLLASLDILMHPAANEPLGRIVLEAMAMGKPVVAVNSAGPGEIIQSGINGMLAAHSQPDELAAAALPLLHDPALAKRVGLAARQRVEQTFDIRRTAAQVEALYDELLTPGGPAYARSH